MKKMIAKSKLALRRAKNRKRKPLGYYIPNYAGIPLKIYVDGKPVEDNTQIFLNPNVLPSSLPGFHWVRKPNPNDGTGFSWYEERIE